MFLLHTAVLYHNERNPPHTQQPTEPPPKNLPGVSPAAAAAAAAAALPGEQEQTGSGTGTGKGTGKGRGRGRGKDGGGKQPRLQPRQQQQQLQRLERDEKRKRLETRRRPLWWQPPVKGAHRTVLALRPADALPGATRGACFVVFVVLGERLCVMLSGGPHRHVVPLSRKAFHTRRRVRNGEY